MPHTIGGEQYISTGSLPPPREIGALVDKVHAHYKTYSDGSVATVYPALERANPDMFGVCLVGRDGALYEAGDALVEFTIMSVSKPFVFALLCRETGAAAAKEKLGVNSTGMVFNSLSALERTPDGRTNPMVNPGAIAATSFIPGATEAERWEMIYEGLCLFAGRKLTLDDETYANAIDTNYRNRGIANALYGMGRLGCDPESAVEMYTRQCCLNVTARDLAVMGATLADGGVNPVTRKSVISNDICHYVLAVMITAGLYETSGDWFYDIGLPGKSGIGGGIVTVSPGKAGLGTFSPLLDPAGNSVRGQLAARYLSRSIGMDLLISEPYVSPGIVI